MAKKNGSIKRKDIQSMESKKLSTKKKAKWLFFQLENFLVI